VLEALHLSDMQGQQRKDGNFNPTPGRGRLLLWVSGAWVVPMLGLAFWIFPASSAAWTLLAVLAALAAPLPALLFMGSQRRRLLATAALAEESAAQLKLQLETVRYRTSRLREELQAADRQARLSHQLTLLGQFTAGFMHEFNNPLAIVAGRLEVLLEERKEDAELCSDLEQMLKEARYMGKIASTLLQALRRERAGEIFEASEPQKALEDALAALRPAAGRDCRSASCGCAGARYRRGSARPAQQCAGSLEGAGGGRYMGAPRTLSHGGRPRGGPD